MRYLLLDALYAYYVPGLGNTGSRPTELSGQKRYDGKKVKGTKHHEEVQGPGAGVGLRSSCVITKT